MRTDRRLPRLVGAGLVLLLSGMPNAAVAMTGQQQAATTQAAASQPQSAELAAAALPDSPGAVRQQSQQPSSTPPQAPAAPQQADQSRPPSKPTGTAAAELTNSGGVTASQPAGAAIAPAKQRRTRSFLIKMGAIIGAGAAIGTVVALSQASGSKPPGAQ